MWSDGAKVQIEPPRTKIPELIASLNTAHELAGHYSALVACSSQYTRPTMPEYSQREEEYVNKNTAESTSEGMIAAQRKTL